MLVEILKKRKEERTVADLEYLEKHHDELTEEHIKQLADEDIVSPLQKNIGQKTYLRYDVEIKANTDGTLRAIVNSGKEDRHGEILDIKGLDVKEYMKNPILANGHDYSKPSVGRTEKLTKTREGQLIADFKFATDIEGYDEPKILDQLYRKKYQFAFSIGFIPQEVQGNIYTKSSMIEFSPVLIPADGNALLLAKQLGLDKDIVISHTIKDMNLQEILKKLAEQGAEALSIAEIKFLNDNKDDLTKKQLDSVEAALKAVEPTKKDEPKNDKPEDETAKALKALTDSLTDMKKDLEGIKASNVKAKDINGQFDGKDFNIVGSQAKMFGSTPVGKDFINDKGEVAKEVKFLHFLRGMQTKDFTDYRNVTKSAMNTSGDNVLIPPVEFIAEIQRLEEQVGVAQRFADVKKLSSGAGVKYVLGDDDLQIFDTAEGGVKKSTKLSYKQVLLTWRKWAGILPLTDELTEDSAINVWEDATRRFARAYAKREDQLVFTEVAAGGNTKDGILHVSGTKVVTVDGTMVDVTYDNLVDMIYGVPTPSAQNGQFYLNREMLGVLAKLHDDQHRPLFVPSIAAGIPATIAGKPFVETEVLPRVSEDDTELPFLAFGDLKYATLGTRSDLTMKMFDAGNVGDPDDEDQSDQLNLLTQDIQVLRAVKRMNAVVRFPAAFSVLKTASHS